MSEFDGDSGRGPVGRMLMLLWEQEAERKADEAKRQLDAVYRAALANVCHATASNLLVSSVLIADPVEAGKAYADSVRWMIDGMLAQAGLPRLSDDPEAK